MGIPKKIKIGGIWYKILFVDNTALDENTLGTCVWEDQLIKIKEGLGDQMKMLTFWHEVLHAANNQLNEEQVEWYAQFLTQIILDNNLSLT